MKVKVSKEYEKAAAEIRKTDAYKRARVISDFTERICRRLEELGITQSELARRLGVRKGADSTDEKGTYAFEVEVCGFFSADPALFAKDKEKALSLVKVNGSSMLLGSVRELVLQLTSRGPFKSYLIPSLSFAEFAK